MDTPPPNPSHMVHKVCIGVCTAKRPLMLKACLGSLLQQEIPSGWVADVIVIDNENLPISGRYVQELSESSPIPLIHVHEPTPGIPFARNHALEVCLARGADWIAFIDDDEIAEPGWLRSFIETTGQYDADVLQGMVGYDYPPSCKWFPPEKHKDTKTGTQLARAASNNVMFRASLARADGLALRFDVGMVFSGGEDIDFFQRAKEMGASIIFVADARATETVVEARCSFWWRMKRHFRTASVKVSHEITKKGYRAAVVHFAPKCFPLFMRALGLLMVLPVLLALRPGSFRGNVYKAGRRLASSLGILSAVMRLPSPQSYRSIEGR